MDRVDRKDLNTTKTKTKVTPSLRSRRGPRLRAFRISMRAQVQAELAYVTLRYGIRYASFAFWAKTTLPSYDTLYFARLPNYGFFNKRS